MGSRWHISGPPEIPPLGPSGSSAPKAILFSSGGRGPFSHQCIFGYWRREHSTLPSALGRTYSEMMVSGSPSLSDRSACSPTGKLPRATAVALLLSGWRDRDGYPLGQLFPKVRGLVESVLPPPSTLLQPHQTGSIKSFQTHV